MFVLQAENLHKHYVYGQNLVKALDGIQLVIEQGEFVGIMGPSGSGKSTLLHLLGGLDQPTEGEIFLASRKVSQLSDQQATLVRRRNVGFVFQFFNLLPTLTAEENILLPLVIDGKNVRDYKDRLEQVLERVGLTTRRRHKPDQLSGGEQQRVALARALITRPSILLADEPTGNLDTQTGASMMRLLRESARDLEQAIVMVTHDPRAAAYTDRVIFLQDGKIIDEIAFLPDLDQAERTHQIMMVQERLER